MQQVSSAAGLRFLAEGWREMNHPGRFGSVFFFILFVLTIVVSAKPATAQSIPSRHVIEGLPILFQGKSECVPVSLAMVLNYWGYSVDREAVKKAIFWSEEEGAPSIDQTIYYLRSFDGLVIETDEGSKVTPETVIREVALGRPVIVRQWFTMKTKENAKKFWILGHWRIVYGYDIVKERFYIQDPVESLGSFEIDFDEFKKLWDVSELIGYPLNWMLVIYREQTAIHR